MFQGIFMYSFGFVMLAATSEDTEKAKNFKIPWRAMVNPAMIASLLALALFFAQIHLPYILNEAMDMVGSITAPIAMMIIGLSFINRTNKRSYIGLAHLRIRYCAPVAADYCHIPYCSYVYFGSAGIRSISHGIRYAGRIARTTV